jgi:hypothetical protein
LSTGLPAHPRCREITSGDVRSVEDPVESWISVATTTRDDDLDRELAAFGIVG